MYDERDLGFFLNDELHKVLVGVVLVGTTARLIKFSFSFLFSDGQLSSNLKYSIFVSLKYKVIEVVSLLLCPLNHKFWIKSKNSIKWHC